MPPDARAIPGVDDSKRLSAAQRDRLAPKIRERAVCYGIGAASVREIDRVNIYQATVIAMRRALGRLTTTPHHVLVDGKPFRTLEIPHAAIVDGDDLCYSIACASILAKVTRDRIMRSLAGRYPDYLWERNVGYSTLAHLQGLALVHPRASADARSVGSGHRRGAIGRDAGDGIRRRPALRRRLAVTTRGNSADAR
jgi:ribonuclease HII